MGGSERRDLGTALAEANIEQRVAVAEMSARMDGRATPGRPFAALLARLDSFRDLAAGWDSYGAQPIDPRAIAKAQELLHSLTVVPTARGGVAIEMGSGDGTVELDISPSGLVWRIG